MFSSTVPLQFQSDDRSPFGPITFLSNMWQSSDHLAGYAQQDCHEYVFLADFAVIPDVG